MNNTHISSSTRWLGVIVILIVASALASPRRPAHDATWTLTTTALRMVPPIFSVPAAQAPSLVCSKKPTASEQMTYTLTSASATHSTAGEQILAGSPVALNFAGLSGPAGVFASGVTLPVGTYTALTLSMDDDYAVNGVITCDPDGGGAIGTRTYYTSGNADFTAADPSVADPNLAAPVLTVYDVGDPDTASIPITFTVSEGQNTTLSVTYDTDEGLQLWDISTITGVPGSYKVLPGGFSILFAVPGP